MSSLKDTLVGLFGRFVFIAHLIISAPVLIVVCFLSIFKNHNSFPFAVCITLSIILLFSFAMSLISFAITMVIEPGSVQSALQSIKLSSYIAMDFSTCPKCNQIKPPRAHHCTQKNKCYLKMDHFCTFLNLVVAIRNHRPFVVMFTWASITSFVSLTSALFSCFFSYRQFWCIVYMIYEFSSLILLFNHLFDFFDGIRHNVTYIEKLSNNYDYDLGEEINLSRFYGNGPFRRLIPLPGNDHFFIN